MAFTPPLQAADPTSGTLGPTLGASVSWKGTAPGGVSDGESTCLEGVNCETFVLNVAGEPANWSGKRITLKIAWLNDTTDYDVYIHKDAVNGPLVTRSADGFTTSEAVFIDPEASGTGAYAVHVVYFTATATDQYSGVATTTEKPTTGVSSQTPPRYFNYPAPGGLGRTSGEPSVGANWNTGNLMYVAWLETLRITLDDSSSPAKSTWINVAEPDGLYRQRWRHLDAKPGFRHQFGHRSRNCRRRALRPQPGWQPQGRSRATGRS
jgi:hypothetical protein